MRIDALRPADLPAVEALLDEAFGANRHTRTAYALRAGTMAIPALSLAARDGARPIASLQCWPILLTAANGRVHSLTLVGPVAVSTAHRGAGIGTALIRACLGRAGDTPMLLIGDQLYYGRFGFTAEHTADWSLPGPVDRARLLARGAHALPRIGTLAAARIERAAA